MDFLYIVASHKERQGEALDKPYVEVCNSSSGVRPEGYAVYDNSFDKNISQKNLMYCELSQLYSMWVNDFDYKMVGLGHYRRLLNLMPHANPHQFQLSSFSDRKKVASSIANSMQVLDNTFFVSTPFNVGSIIDHFDLFHPQLSDLFRHSFSVFQKQNSNLPSAEIFFRNSGMLSTCNMFFGSKDLVDRFCNQIFDLLFELEKDAPSDLDGYQSRWAGFFAERYLSFFISQISEEANIIYKPVITFD